jgi:glycerol kinase
VSAKSEVPGRGAGEDLSQDPRTRPAADRQAPKPAPLLLAIDQGTTSSRAILFDENLRRIASARREFPQYFPDDGWVEHDAEEIWRSVIESIREALDRAGRSFGDVTAIGVTNQRETVVVWDRASGRPVHRAIVWQDRRTAPAIRNLEEQGLGPLVTARTGLLLDPYFSASKLAWILERIPDGLARARDGSLAAGTVDSWLIWKLSGGARHVTDITNASRTLLMDLGTGKWDGELLEVFGIPAAVLPRIVSSGGEMAVTSSRVAGAEVPVAAAIGDQQAALFGQWCVHPGLVKCTYGTGCFLLAFTGEERVESTHRLLTTVAWRIGDSPVQYALEGSVFMGGAAIQWLRDGLGIIASAPEVNSLAGKVPDAGGVVLVPSFTGLGAPHWDASARGAILGLSRGTTSAHIARATLEAIACQVADVLDAMRRDSGLKTRMVRADGGAAASDLLMQIQADVLGVPVERPGCIESTALGTAMLAGLATGVFPDLASLGDIRTVDRVFEPVTDAAGRRRRRGLWRKAVKRAGRWTSDPSPS